MGRERICIDSCVFFHLTRYNDAYEKEGSKKLLETIKVDEERYRKSIENFENFMKNFIDDKNNSLSFEKKLAIMSNIMKGDNVPFSQDVKDMYHALNEEYAKANSYAHIGSLYLKYLSKGVDFYLTPTTRREIDYHKEDYIKKIEQGINPKKPGKEVFSDESIDRMMKRCSPVKFPYGVEQDFIIKLSEAFRGKRQVKGLENIGQAMPNHLNSLKIYGDSLIMAESACAGLPLVTQNTKDFIIDKGEMFDKKNNLLTKRRDKISLIINKLGLNPSALPYSVLEFLNNSAEVLELEKVLTMDQETFDRIFNHKSPSNNRKKYYEQEDDGMCL